MTTLKIFLFALTASILWLTTDYNPKPQTKNLTLTTQEKNIIWTVTEGEANTIITGLNELPAKTANPLIQKLIMQAQKQLQDTIKKK